MNHRQTQPITTRVRTGITYVEVVLSTVLVGTLAVTALSASSFHSRNANRLKNQALASALADRLLSEVSGLRFRESTTSTALGVDLGEQTTTRSTWDDVDDATSYSASPPRNRAGSPRTELNGWTESINVEYSSPSTLATTSTVTGLKRITVTVVANTGETIVRQTLVNNDSAADPVAKLGSPVSAVELKSTNFLTAPGTAAALRNRPIP